MCSVKSGGVKRGSPRWLGTRSVWSRASIVPVSPASAGPPDPRSSQKVTGRSATTTGSGTSGSGARTWWERNQSAVRSSRTAVASSPRWCMRMMVAVSVRSLDNLVEERDVGLRHSPVIGGRDEVGRQIETTKQAARAHGLVPDDAYPDTHLSKGRQGWAHIRVEVILAEPLRLASIRASLALLIEVKPRLEHLERFSVVQTLGDHRAEHGDESMARNAQPVRPGAVLPGLVHKGLADIEHNSLDHHCSYSIDYSAAPTAPGQSRVRGTAMLLRSLTVEHSARRWGCDPNLRRLGQRQAVSQSRRNRSRSGTGLCDHTHPVTPIAIAMVCSDRFETVASRSSKVWVSTIGGLPP